MPFLVSPLVSHRVISHDKGATPCKTHTRRKGVTPVLPASSIFIPSSRRNSVLHPEDLEMWASHTPALVSTDGHSLGRIVTGQLLHLDREVEGAEDLDELCATVISHHAEACRLQTQHSPMPGQNQQNSSATCTPLYAPRTLSTALLRLTDLETDSGPSELYGGTLMPRDVNNQRGRVLEILQDGVVAACKHQPSPQGPSSLQALHSTPPASYIDTGLMANYLWSLATLHGADSRLAPEVDKGSNGAKASGLEKVCAAVSEWAQQNFNDQPAIVQTASTPDLNSMLWGYAALTQLASGQARGSNLNTTMASTNASSFMDALAAEMTSRILQSETGRDLQPADLADTAWALLVSGHRSRQVVDLAEAVATEVSLQISNRHSLKAPFTSLEAIKVVVSLSHLGLKSRAMGSAFDAVAGHVVKRIRARSVSAIDKPGDILALLSAYADAGHSSVVVPELVEATAGQLVSDVAAFHQWLCNHERPSPCSYTPRACKYWQSHLDSRTIAGLLHTFVRLNLHPGELLLASLSIALQPQLRATELHHLNSLVQDFETLGHACGANEVGQTALQAEVARRAAVS